MNGQYWMDIITYCIWLGWIWGPRSEFHGRIICTVGEHGAVFHLLFATYPAVGVWVLSLHTSVYHF